jgi:mannose-6-phosphate isomerase-like protein (cupin superfamily)
VARQRAQGVQAGTLIVISKGTAHGGTLVTSGPVKAIAIKIPPQPKDDVTFLN